MNKIDIIVFVIVFVLVLLLIGINLFDGNIIDHNIIESFTQTKNTPNLQVITNRQVIQKPQLPLKLPNPPKPEINPEQLKQAIKIIQTITPEQLAQISKSNEITKQEETIKRTPPYNITNTKEENIINIASVNVPYTNITDKSVRYPDYDLIIQYGDMDSEYDNMGVMKKQSEEKLKTEEKQIKSEEYKKQMQLLMPKINVDLPEDFIDPAEYYRKHQKFIKSTMDDPIMRGSNIKNYNHYSKTTDIGRIDLTNDKNYPEPEEYIFNTSAIF